MPGLSEKQAFEAAASIDGPWTSVRLAIEEALMKHGLCTSDFQRMVVNLTEELGEVARPALDLTRPHAPTTDALRLLLLRDMRRELCQLAAYAILCINKIDHIDQGGIK